MSIELVCICQAETEENEKFRSFYEAVQKIKELHFPSVTQIVHTIRILKQNNDPTVSVLGLRQLVNIKLKLNKLNFWTRVDAEFDHFLSDSSLASRQTSFELVPTNVLNKCEVIPCLDSSHGSLKSNAKQLNEWLRNSSAKRVLLVGCGSYFKKLFHCQVNMRSCDVHRLQVTFTADRSVKCRFSPPRLLFRTDLSSPHPTDTLLSWRHILYGSSTDSAILGEPNKSTCEASAGRAVTVAFSSPGSSSSSTDDLNPVCRICQTTFQEMPERPLIKPCRCSGTLRYVHVDCLHTWRATSPYAYTTCSVCRHPYRVRTSLLARYLVNEDATFLVSLTMMAPISYCVGVLSSALIRYLLTLTCCGGGYELKNTIDVLAVLGTILPLRAIDDHQTASLVDILQLGASVLGVCGFFSTYSLPALLAQTALFVWAAHNSLVAAFCLLVGWGTVMRELHLTLIRALRAVNSWIGTIILEPS